MKMVYSHESAVLVNNIKNLVEAQGINTFIKNEFAQGAVGEISATDAWPELWILDARDFDPAIAIVEALKDTQHKADWRCENCTELNDPSFEICWNCQCDNECSSD